MTTGKDFVSDNDVWKAFISFGETIGETLRENGLYALGVQVHIRTASLKVKEFSLTYPTPTDCAITLAKRGFELFKKNYSFGEPLRSVGLRAISLKSEVTAGQIDMFGDIRQDIKTETVDKSIYEVRKKFGKDSLKRGRNI